ncbi:MAG: hypothetical protein V1809_14025 [Planctomycetota bacterium]
MSGRFDKALSDLQAWRSSRDAFLKPRSASAGVASVVRSIDSALKSEVLEWRIRGAIAAQVATEAAGSRVPAAKTETGRHLWDLDWWLTESTMRALHAGMDGLAQLLNVAFNLGVEPDDPNLPQQVAKILGHQPELAGVSRAVGDLWSSKECKNLRAFVNHVKHAGCPARGMNSGDSVDGFPRLTSVERFTYESSWYGPWSPSDIEAIMDEFRAHVLKIMEAVAAERRA